MPSCLSRDIQLLRNRPLPRVNAAGRLLIRRFLHCSPSSSSLSPRTRLVAEYLELKPGSYSTSFQSRLAGDKWLDPYTDKTIESFAKSGMKDMAVVTPAFVSDCLETLEEIGMEAVEDFEDNGGKNLHVVPCINDRDEWVKVLSRWIDEWAMAS